MFSPGVRVPPHPLSQLATFRGVSPDPDGGGGPQTSPITKFGYSSAGDLVKQYQPDASVQTWTYHATWHLPLTFTNELNKTWTFTYATTAANLLTEQDPLSNTTTLTYTSLGLLDTHTTADPDGGASQTSSVTDLDYDAYGRLEEINNPGGSTRTFTYSTADLLLTTTDELSHVWTNTYDNLNRLTSETTPDPDAGGSQTAATTTYTWDVASRLTKVTDALGNDTDYTFNNRNFVTQVQQPDADGAGPLGRLTSTYEFNALGQVTQEGQYHVLGENFVTHTYNDAGWLVGTVGPIAEVGVNYVYDNLGRRIQATEYDQQSVNYRYVKQTYNSRDWVTSTIQSVPESETLVDGPTTTYSYDAAGQLVGQMDPRGYSTAYAYNDAGWLTKITLADPDGPAGGLISPAILVGFDNIGRPTSQTDPLGRVTSTAYDNRHRVIKVTGPDPDGAGSASAPESENQWDAANNLTGVIDPLDRETNYGFDNANRLITVTLEDPDGAGSASSPVYALAYNKMNSVTSMTDPLNNVTLTTYDNLQRQTQITEADPDSGGPLSSPVTQLSYNAQGLLAKITDPLSRETNLGYDNYGRPTTTTNHEGKVTTTAFDIFRRVTSVTTPDPDGAGTGQTASVTSYQFDTFDRVTAIDDPRGGDTTFTYDVMGNLLNLQDASGNDTSWVYDGLSRVTQETNELSNSRYFVYDAASNLIRKTDRNSRVTRYEYDQLDRLTSELWIDSGAPTPTVTGATTTQGGATGEVQRVGFDAQGGELAGGTFTLTFDGQTTGTIAYNASASTVRAALEGLSNIDPGEVSVEKSLDMLSKQEWRLTFAGDLAGSNQPQTTVDSTLVTPFGGPGLIDIEATDVTGSTNSEVQTVTLGNTPTGGTFKLTLGTEQTSAIAYNATAATLDSSLESLASVDTVTVTGNAGGPYTITFTGSHTNQNVAQLYGDATYLTKGTTAKTITNVYDVASQLTSTGDGSNSNAYTYDNLGRILTDTQVVSGLTPSVVLTSTYNANSRRTSLAATIGGTTDFKNDYTFDNLSRMTQIVQQDVSGGNVVADKRVDFAFNGLGQYTSIARYQSTGTSNHVATSTFTYDTLNRLTDLDHKQGATNLALYDYTYDFMDRIASMTHNVDGQSTITYDKESQVTAADHASPRADESFTFDVTGNRTGGSYTNTTNNRTTADATYTYDYDSEGNRSKRTKTSDGSYQEYTWDHRNRLTKVTFKNSSHTVLQTVEYKYDSLNRLVRRTHDADGPGGAAATDAFFAGYDGINATLDFDGAAASDLLHRNLWGAAVDQILATEDVTSLTSAGNLEWALTDHQGTARDVADLNEGTGTTSVTNHLTINAFGILTAETNGSIEFAFSFMGKPHDDTTTFIYYVNRWYDPALGKWTGEDPIHFIAGDPNIARMVGNDVLNLTDPFGLWAYPIRIPPVPGPTVVKTSVVNGPCPCYGYVVEMEYQLSDGTIVKKPITALRYLAYVTDVLFGHDPIGLSPTPLAAIGPVVAATGSRAAAPVVARAAANAGDEVATAAAGAARAAAQSGDDVASAASNVGVKAARSTTQGATGADDLAAAAGKVASQLDPPALPPFSKSNGTQGVLRTPAGDVALRSGVEGPARTVAGGPGSGFDILTRTHVEGHAAALMQQEGISAATVYINNPVICPNCVNNLPRMLPRDARLTVIVPDGTAVTFTGGSNSVSAVLPTGTTVTFSVAPVP